MNSNGPLPGWVSYLVEAGRLAPSADNSQPWRFVFDDRTLAVEFEPQRGGMLGRDHPAVLLAFGCLAENLLQAAQHAGIATDHWRFCDFITSGRLLEIPAPTCDPAPVELPKSIRERHTNRFPYATTPLAADIISTLEQMREGSIHPVIFTNSSDIHELANLVRLASELRFQTEEIHRWLSGSLRFTAEEIARGDGLDVNTLALPPGGRMLSRFLADWDRMAFLNRFFGLYKLLARIEAAQLERTSAIVILLCSDKPSSSRWLEAGRLMERIWLWLTQNRFSVQPYFVLPDQIHRQHQGHFSKTQSPLLKELAQKTSALLGADPLMMLRIGKAKKPTLRSLRLPRKAILEMAR